MGTWRNKADEELIIPTAGVTVQPDDTFMVPDADDDAYARNVNLAPVDASAHDAQDTVDGENVAAAEPAASVPAAADTTAAATPPEAASPE